MTSVPVVRALMIDSAPHGEAPPILTCSYPDPLRCIPRRSRITKRAVDIPKPRCLGI